jgi:uncharacterized membrane protein (UPF0127 family)
VENKIYQLKTTKGETLCHKMIVANTMLSRMKGLMFAADLPDCDGLLLKPGNSIHTFFMLFSLDVVFLDKNFKIVKIIYDMTPWKMTRMYFKSHQVLEMKAGTLKKNLNVGEMLEAVCIN